MSNETMLRTYDSTVLPILTCYKKVLDILDDKIPVPNVAELFITNFCNFKCVHCRCMETLSKESYAYMDFELFAKVIRELAGKGVKCIHLAGGGEPLVHPRITDMLRLIHSYDMKLAIYTNGYRFTQSDSLVDTALKTCDSIRFSLDAASEDTMKKVHGVENISYTRLRNTISRMTASPDRLPKIGLKMLISKLNVNDVEEFINKGVDMGVDYLQFRFLTFPKELALEPGLVEEVSARLGEYISRHDSIKTQIDVVPSYAAGDSCGRCMASLLHTVIDYDGEVYICPFFETRKETHSIGNLKTTGNFFDIWYSQKHLDAREKIDYSKCVANCQMLRYNKVIDFISSDSYRFDFI